VGVGSAAHHANQWHGQVRSLNRRQGLSDDQADLLTPADHLVSYRCRAKSTEVFVLFSFRENQKEALAHRHGSATLWAIEFGGIKFLKRLRPVRVLGGTRWLIYKVPGLHGSRVLRAVLLVEI
jgi:hypothetical protein